MNDEENRKMNNELSIKESAFNNIIKWLTEHNFDLKDKVIDRNPTTGLQFSINGATKSKRPYPFNIKFLKEFNDSFVITSTIAISDEDNTAFQNLRKKERIQVYMDIRKIVYPFNIHCNLKMPIILIFRILTIDSITNNKQFLIDQVYNIIHCEELIQIRFDELFYSMFPEGKSRDDSLV